MNRSVLRGRCLRDEAVSQSLDNAAFLLRELSEAGFSCMRLSDGRWTFFLDGESSPYPLSDLGECFKMAVYYLIDHPSPKPPAGLRREANSSGKGKHSTTSVVEDALGTDKADS